MFQSGNLKGSFRSSELHRPDPKRPAHMQDKRMVVILNEDDYDAWLDAPAERSMEFLQQYPAERLLATPEPKEQ
jgi:putative SOS response-associated peptidase YedK